MTRSSHAGDLRVLLCTGEFPPDPSTGGIGTAVRAGAAALAGVGFDVHVLHAQVGVDEADLTDPHGFTVHRRCLPSRVGRAVARSGLLHAAGFRFHADRLGAFDLVEAPEWEAVVSGFVVRRRQPTVAVLYTPTEVVRSHGSTAGNRFRCRFERWGVRRSDAAVSCGPTLADLLAVRGWHDAQGGLLVQPPCLAPELVDLEPEPLGPRPRILGIGRLEPRKGFDLLIRAAARLPEPPEVVLVGRDVGDRNGPSNGARLAGLAADLGVPLELVPPMSADQLGPWFSGAWVVAVPSTFESFSMVGLEAAAHGRAVVATDSVGFAVLAAGSDGVLVVPDDPDRLAASLAPLVADQATAERAGRVALGLAREQFGPAVYAERRAELYRRLTASCG